MLLNNKKNKIKFIFLYKNVDINLNNIILNIILKNLIFFFRVKIKNINISLVNNFNIKNIVFSKFNKMFVLNNKDLKILKLFLNKNFVKLIRGYCLVLTVIGLGFTMTIWKNSLLRFNIGYNHLIYYYIPKGILIRSKSRRNLFLFSNSFFILKKISLEIKNFRCLSPYKLKGIKDKNELYKKKNWKKAIY